MYLSQHNISKLTLQLRIPASTQPTLYLPHYQSVTVTGPEHIPQALKAARIGSGLRSTQQTGVQSCNRTKVEPQPACIDLRFRPELYSRVLTPPKNKVCRSQACTRSKHAQGRHKTCRQSHAHARAAPGSHNAARRVISGGGSHPTRHAQDYPKQATHSRSTPDLGHVEEPDIWPQP